MTDSLYSKDDEAKKSRARHVLIEALKRADIPEQVLGEYRAIYWHSLKIGESEEIKVSITTHGWGTGWTTLHLYPESLAHNLAETYSDDDERITNALVDALSYIKFTVSQILGQTQQLLNLRGINEYCKRYPDGSGDDLKKGYALLGEPLRRGFEKARKDMENKLALEPIAKRGGSDRKLPPDERDSLHVLYDGIRKVTKHIKGDYNATFKAFAKARRKQGYNRAQWKAYWKKYSEEKYPAELHDMLPLFGVDGDPSAADVAYTFIAKVKGHKKSYLPKLIRESRKKARTLKAGK